MLKYSFIIPTFNEELNLPSCLDSLKKHNDKVEIIIADGGSTDTSSDIAKTYNVKIVQSRPGRGIQLNSGIKEANGEILCFLHADTILPVNAFELLEKFFNNPDNKICRFKLGFDIDHWLLNIYKSFSKLDTIFTRFGDSFIGVRKDFYKQIGGFPNWEIFEDVEFFKRASKLSRVKILNAEVISSSRNFLKYGIVRQQIFSGKLMLKYFLGFRNFVNNSDYYSRKEIDKEASIIVFVKYPSEGKVKTRLAKSIGNAAATKFYKNISENIVNSVKQIAYSYKYIFYSEEIEKELIKKWLGWKLFYCNQNGIDLGERMKYAFRKVFCHGSKKVIIVGTDIPDLTSDIINTAAKKLNEKDIVIGPSFDGGFYLLGMKKYTPSLFENIQYSTNMVFNETIKKIENLNLSCHVLQTLQDIDTEDDLRKWINEKSNQNIKNKVKSIIGFA